MKVNHAAILGLFILAALAGFNLFGQGANQAPKQRWEYQVEQLSPYNASKRLREAGQEGWELVAVATSHDSLGKPSQVLHHYFKRPLP